MSEDYLRRSVKSRLNVSVDSLRLKARAPQINDLDPTLPDILEQNVLRLQITVDYLMLVEIRERDKQLNRKASDEPHGQPLERVALNELVQINTQQLERNTLFL